MVDRGKIKVVDGFLTVKAVEKAKATRPSTAGGEKKKSPTAATPAAASKPAAGPRVHIGHTALPTKYDISCYHCGFGFTMTGRKPHTYCPKCKNKLDTSDHIIDGLFNDTIKTAGKVRVLPTGVIEGGDISTNDLVLEGKIQGGQVTVQHTLEFAPGCAFNESRYTARDIRIAADARISLHTNTRYRNVEILGELTAKLQADGVVTIKPGGCMKGEIRGEHLVVEDGGGLLADLYIEKAPEKVDPASDAAEKPASP